MELKDALIVTGLGLSVVFIGLILTNLMIYSFSAIPRFLQRFKKTKEESPAEAPAAPAGEAESAELDPDIIAVITTVLEIEFRKMALLEGRFTFK